MAKFSYIVKDTNGKTISDVVDASTREAGIKKLQDQGYFIVSLEEFEKGPSKQKTQKLTPKKKRSFRRKKVKLEDMLIFCRQLGTMLESGVTLTRSLDVIAPSVESQRLSTVLFQVKKDIESGLALHTSLAKHPKVFNQFMISLMEVGETAGTLPEVLNRLANYLEQQAEFRSLIKSALIYPVILFFLVIGAVLVFALFVGPKFEDIFSSFGAELPALTQIVLNTFHFVREKFLILALVLCGILVLGKAYLKTNNGRLQFEGMIFGIPVLGEVVKFILTERFTSQLAILINSGVPILLSLDISQRLIGNRTCELIISDIKEGVREGELLFDSMDRSAFFPTMATQMILVGEETGELEKMLNHVARFYEQLVSRFMKNFGAFIEPIMIIFMGVVIGTLVVSMFLPLFSIANLGSGR